MTRETKIGLLVGLAFIIVIGILLSDHIQTSTEPPRAALTSAADVVSNSVNTPGQTNEPAVVITPPANLQPSETVPTSEDINRPESAQTVVRIAPQPGNAQQPVTIIDTPAPVQEIRQPEIVTNEPAPLPQPVETEVFGADPPDGIVEVAHRNGEEIVNVAGSGITTMKSYVAQPGDTLSKMAGRFMGGNTKANRDAIVKANPFMKGDPNKIIAGRKYLIPVASSAPVIVPVAETIVPAAPSAPSNQPEYIYTVKAGDNLWKIAANQLGDGTAWTSIKELNKDTLKGGETVIEGMKLRLPAKPVASAD